MPDVKLCLFVRRVGTLSYTPRTGISPVVRRVRSFFHTPRVGMCQVGRRVRVIFDAPWGNLSGRSLGGESLLHALYWNLSRSSVER